MKVLKVIAPVTVVFECLEVLPAYSARPRKLSVGTDGINHAEDGIPYYEVKMDVGPTR